MRPSQYTWLGITFAGGILWIFLAQNWIFLNVFPELLAGNGINLQKFLQTGSSPSFTALWISCVIALIGWITITLNGQPRNVSDVLHKRTVWWSISSLLLVLGVLYQTIFTVFIWLIPGNSPMQGSGINYYPVPAGGWLLLILFVVLDVILLFWLPTLLASPRSYRLVVPGAVKLFGGH